MVSLVEPGTTLTFLNNEADWGGAAIFLRCIRPGNTTTDMFDARRRAGISTPAQNLMAALSFTGNIAGFGEKVATLAQGLQLTSGNGTRYSYQPGEALESTLFLHDGFGQTVRTRQGKLPLTMSVVACIEDECEKVEPILSSIHEFDEGGLCDLSKQRTPLAWVVKQRLAPGERVFEQDISIRHVMSGAVDGVTMNAVVFNVTRSPCPDGTSFIETRVRTVKGERIQGTCEPCKTDQYVTEPDQYSCIGCPLGGSCDGKIVRGKDGQRSTWEAVNEYYRVQSCPIGNILVRAEASPATDQCAACPTGTFTFFASTYFIREGYPDLKTDDPAAAPGLCSECPVGADCPGGSVIIPKRGYWMKNYKGDVTVGTARRRLRSITGKTYVNSSSVAETTGQLLHWLSVSEALCEHWWLPVS